MRSAVPAFSLLEVMIVVLLIGLGASLVMPRLFRRAPETDWKHVSQELNTMLYFARQEAITTQKVHRLVFDKRAKVIFVESESGRDAKGQKTFEPVASFYFTSRYQLPERLTMKSALLGKKNLFDQNKQRQAYCHVVPNGLIEEVMVTFTRTPHDEEEPVGLLKVQAAPFLGEFENREVVG